MRLPLCLGSASFLCAAVDALGQQQTVAFNGTADDLLLASSSASVRLILDAADWPGVLRAADDVALDFGRVTGLNGAVTLDESNDVRGNASVIFNVTGKSKWDVSGDGEKTAGVIIAGTVGKSSLIDTLVKDGKVDVSGVEGQWEAFASGVVHAPIDGVDWALVVAGSDKRGTIYGLYDISEQIGVSPWHWFADVPTRRQSTIFASNTTKKQGSPSVKYRGLFINDEAPALTGWMNANYPKSEYGSAFGADFYAHVFELLLRLRANYLWPAMWGSMFNVDDARSQPLADEYGIVMGTSHTEPMMRATNEWTTFGQGAWQWNTNNASIYPFFVEGAERAKPYEGIVTMGMRGSGDTALSAGIETAMLENIVDTQRSILEDVYGNVTAVPQMWCLYKEVQGYYEAGMRVPDDVTLLWTDDNWGNMRRLPTGNETDRSGGAGIYYHFDYVGDPRDYKWINTIQLEKTWEQLRLTYERGARDIWIVNVGDLKPLEIPISHFLDLAYDIDKWSTVSTEHWLSLWATREFGAAVAKDTARVVDVYGKLAARRKYELLNSTIYSIVNYEEAENVLGEWETLARDAQSIYDSLSAEARPSFFELVLHPVLAGLSVYDIHISSAKNLLYAAQGRTSANAWADRVLSKFRYDHELTVRYNSLLDGKWNHMMDQTHLGYVYWQQPMRQVTPPLQFVQTLEGGLNGDMGVSVEGSKASVPGDDQWHDLSSDTLTLPPIDPFGSRRWIDIFSTGTQPCSWNISAAPFLKLSQSSGMLVPSGNATETRVYITIDWDAVADASGSTTINVTSSTGYGTQYTAPKVVLPYNRTAIPSAFTNGFVESDGHVSIEAAHYSAVVAAETANTTAEWTVISSYGRTHSGVALSPGTLPSLTTKTAPALAYNILTFSPLLSSNASVPNANLTLYLSPSMNTDPARPLRYAVAVDDQEPQTVQFVVDRPDGALPAGWEEAVADAAWRSRTGWVVPPGAHVVRLWALEPGVVVQKMVLDMGGVRESYLGPPESCRVE
ncbi:uncharacterized protein J3D65DRAFT_696996 [Phyllosticta citribraziliensis]|uniref:Gylcosyl hydrolase 115 C-terminal domain-containing protein n=1 Tax=Phyllosticta citribraziliensis TaxID=989973 RepID=A0ABR1LRR5_9PEZI